MLAFRRVAAAASRSSFRAIHVTRTSLGGHGLSIHRDTDDNNADTPFEFTKESLAQIDVLLAKYPEGHKDGALLPILDVAQRQNDGWLPLSAMKKTAKLLDISPIRVYEVASFYTMYNRNRIGKHHIQVCTTTPCMVRDAYEIVDVIKDTLNINVGETTKDGLFTLSEVECLGACVNAPMMQIDSKLWNFECKYFEDLTPESTRKILSDLKAGRVPKFGPQGKRKVAMPAEGKTSLLSEPVAPPCRDFATIRAEREAAKAAAAAEKAGGSA